MSYINHQKRQTLDSIENQVLYADLCCVIIGPHKIGKSFFLKQLARRTSTQVNIAHIKSNQQLSPQDINTQISQSVGFDLESKGVNIIEKAAAKLSQRVLVMLDDAEVLNDEAKAYLLELVKRQFDQKETQLFILLSGTSQLAEQLAQSDTLKQNPELCAVFELEPFEKSETQHFIADFQEIDVGTTLALYDEQKIDYFWRLSHGLPGQLKEQIERWLNQQEVVKPEPKQSFSASGYIKAFSYACVCLALVAILVYQDEINQIIDNQAPKQTELLEAESKAINDKQFNTEKLSTEISRRSSSVEETLEQPQIESTTQPAVAKEQKPSKLVKVAPTIEPAKLTQSQPKQTDSDTTSKGSKSDPYVNSRAKPKAIANPEKPNTPPALSQQQLTSDKTNQLTDDEAYLASLADNLYTLQWVGLSSHDAAISYRDKHPLKDQMSIFRRKTKNGYLFLVISNTYLSKVDAEHARVIYIRRDYPGKPWIKSLKSVQQDIAQLN